MHKMTPDTNLGQDIGEGTHAVSNVEMVGKNRTRITFRDGASIELKNPRMERKGLRDEEIMGISVMQLAIPLAFQEEFTGIDAEWGFLVEQQEGIRDLPHHAEANVYEALDWAGSRLQSLGINSYDVADVLMKGSRNITTSFHLGNLSTEQIDIYRARLRWVIVSHYPGAGAAIKRSREKPAPQW